MIEFKIDIIVALEKKGWTQQKIRNQKLLGQSSYYAMKNQNKVPGLAGINALCYMLGMQPGFFLRYVPDDLQ